MLLLFYQFIIISQLFGQLIQIQMAENIIIILSQNKVLGKNLMN